MFDINHCKLDIALGAQKLLGDMKLQDILNQSCGAATFFEWVCYLSIKLFWQTMLYRNILSILHNVFQRFTLLQTKYPLEDLTRNSALFRWFH